MIGKLIDIRSLNNFVKLFTINILKKEAAKLTLLKVLIKIVNAVKFITEHFVHYLTNCSGSSFLRGVKLNDC